MANCLEKKRGSKMKNEQLPTIQTYGDYSTSNYGVHCMMVHLPRSKANKHGLTIYYSYETCIAFRGYIDAENCGLFVIKNYWGSTTGKHLNAIDGGNKEKRLDEKTFEKLFKKALRNA